MPVGAAEDYAAFGAILTEVVDTGIAEIIPNNCKLQKLRPFKQSSVPQGLKHVQPTIVRLPGGFSHIRAGTGPAQLNPAKAAKIERAEVVSNSIYLVDMVDKDMIDRAKGGSGGYSKAAVKQVTAVLMPALIASAKREEEICAMHGQNGRGKVTKQSTWPSISTVNGVTQVIVDKTEWAGGIWAGNEGMDLAFFDDATNTFLGLANLTTVNMDTKALILDANLTSIFTAVAVGPISIWRGSTRVQVNGTPQYNESIGLGGILSNTGVLFNIDAAKYNLFKSPQYDVGTGRLTLGKILSMSSRASYNGTDDGVVIFVAPDTWTDLAADETTFRKWESGPTGPIKVGPESLAFYGASGSMAVMAHPMMKRGYAWMLNISATSKTPGGDIKQIGDSEWKYDDTGGDVLHYVPGYSGYEIRLRMNKAEYINPPGRSLQAINILDTQP